MSLAIGDGPPIWPARIRRCRCRRARVGTCPSLPAMSPPHQRAGDQRRRDARRLLLGACRFRL